jgi:hypothetical protein
MNNRANQFVTRSKNATRRFQLGGIDYETAMNLLTEHAHRVSRLSNSVVSQKTQATAMAKIYDLMEWIQVRETPHVVSEQFDSLIDLGDGNYVTPQRHVEY